ncbi:uncharacterized protein BDR25DRAFT_95330 [Lindgomyces ingoldianus]|uniref:Uncharacterized protein n=1 Tax=Lindgomyces ingoldianus TaxID=673940 RepID=A0ACB6QF81_9PLEO|nr:uncharacterized protein BDR25DRAFT_95330 [Lindgomyces ingoldianus]KAF2464810.1 hypothetical protein BDR25DRAFT_95330 [Lindgomyces ingoldianus]
MFGAATKFAKGGYHQGALTKNDVVALQKVFYASSFLQTSTLALAKLSLLVLLHRVFEIMRGFQITCWVLGVIVSFWWTATFFAGAFICYPASHIWQPNESGTCGNQVLLDLISPIPWVLTDFIILIAPIPVIRKLQLPKEQRIRVFAAFLIGAITCIVSVIRYRTLFYPLDDFSWGIIPAADWNLIEIHVTIMCPALLTSRPVVAWLISNLRPRWVSLASLTWTRLPRSRATGETSNLSATKGASTSNQNKVSGSSAELREVVNKPHPSDSSLVAAYDIPEGHEWV